MILKIRVGETREEAVIVSAVRTTSGARVLITLLYAMEDLQAKRGMASLCLGGRSSIVNCRENIVSSFGLRVPGS